MHKRINTVSAKNDVHLNKNKMFKILILQFFFAYKTFFCYNNTLYKKKMCSSMFHIFFCNINTIKQHCIAYVLIALINCVCVCVFKIFFIFVFFHYVYLNINGYLVNLFFQLNNLLALIITIHK